MAVGELLDRVEDVERFGADGFVVVRAAMAADIVRQCVDIIHDELRARGIDRDDPRTWLEPVVRLPCPEAPPFTAAGASPLLHRHYDALVGRGRWVRRDGVGGTIPVRFPSTRDPGDAGWHIDGSYDVNGQWWVNVHSRYRGLLALFLFTDVTERDAPTELIVGSHLDVPRVLAPHGERGVFFGNVTRQLHASTFRRPYAQATGRAGDVYLCHPFLVHRATWPHVGTRPRMVAQPAIGLREPFALRDGDDVCAVERAILRGLQSDDEPDI